MNYIFDNALVIFLTVAHIINLFLLTNYRKRIERLERIIAKLIVDVQ